MYKIGVTVLLVVVCIGIALGDGPTRRSRLVAPRKLADDSFITSTDVRIPMVAGAPFSRIAGDPSQGDPFLLTNYDIGWNNPTNHFVVSYAPSPALPGTHAHFTAMYRAVGGVRSQYYIYYEGTKYVGAATIPPTVRGTGFGGLDVFQGGAGDGFAVVASHVPVGVAVNGAPGDTVFTFTNLPTQPPNMEDPKVHIDNNSATQTVYCMVTPRTRNTPDYWLWKSDDYGTTWTFVDSMAHWINTIPTSDPAAISALDPNFQVMPNGDIYCFVQAHSTSASGTTQTLPPLGEGTTDQVNRYGYLKSTNHGISWTWTEAFLEGSRVNIATGDTLDYAIPLTNGSVFINGLGHTDGCIDASGVVHLVMGAPAIHFVDSLTYHLVFSILYWNSSTRTWVNVSRSADTHNAWNDSLLASRTWEYCDNSVGGPVGRNHPAIGYYPGSKDIFVAWSEPSIVGSHVDTLHDKWINQIWYNRSNDGGKTWLGPTQLTTSLTSGKYFTTVGRQLTLAGSATNKLRTHLGYLDDPDNRNLLNPDAGAATNLLKPWKYHTVDFTMTDVKTTPGLPNAYSLEQNYPNPFNPSTQIEFTLPSRSDVKLTVYNVLGQEVATLVNETREAGTYQLNFSAERYSSGVYFYTLKAGQYTDTKKMVLMK